jgi:thiol-disulfide isomerase/thioredoxin
MTIIELNEPDVALKPVIPKIKKCLGGNTVVGIFAVWCPHCSSMRDDWDLLKNDLKAAKVNVVEIESANLDRMRSAHPLMFKKIYGVSDRVYYPMIQMWKKNKSMEYEDERTYDNMKKVITDYYKTKPKAAAAKKKAKGTTKAKKGGAYNFKEFEKQLDAFIKKTIKENSR